MYLEVVFGSELDRTQGEEIKRMLQRRFLRKNTTTTITITTKKHQKDKLIQQYFTYYLFMVFRLLVICHFK